MKAQHDTLIGPPYLVPACLASMDISQGTLFPSCTPTVSIFRFISLSIPFDLSSAQNLLFPFYLTHTFKNPDEKPLHATSDIQQSK